MSKIKPGHGTVILADVETARGQTATQKYNTVHCITFAKQWGWPPDLSLKVVRPGRWKLCGMFRPEFEKSLRLMYDHPLVTSAICRYCTLRASLAAICPRETRFPGCFSNRETSSALSFPSVRRDQPAVLSVSDYGAIFLSSKKYRLLVQSACLLAEAPRTSPL